MKWKKFGSEISKLGEMIIKDSFKPDLIIGVARGGWIPVRYLSSIIGVKKLASIGVTYKDESRTDLILYSSPVPILENSKILLVEDMLESGKSLVFAKEELEKNKAIVKTASLYYLPKSVIIPDYSLGERENVKKFPWEN